jgi:hypothetical protein
VLTAYAFLCLVTASDCEREAHFKMRVGDGNTPISCLQDGQEGVARAGIEVPDGERIVVKCLRR